MGGRPPKHLSLVTGHLVKAEKKIRADGEARMTATAKMKMSKEVRKDKIAAAHFKRLELLYAQIDMCDGLCENAVNRYCLLLSTLHNLDESGARIYAALRELEARKADMDISEYLRTLTELQRLSAGNERAAAKVRDQLLAIERENLLTINGKLKAVPKKPDKPEAQSGFSAYREKYGGRDG